ncbi:MAG: Crp/Fnr family transcriptional regulator [Spirochaetaceae bacterium]|nr:Crp/Fnr family transcriptional regulator [Spirochaetaceae bacterium]
MEQDKVRTFKPGELIFREGEKGDLMYVLLEGSVELKMKVEKGETVLKTVDTPNDFFGEMALLDDRPRSASAVALRPTKVLAVDRPTFESMILTNGKFALKIIKMLSARVRRSNTAVSELIETLPRERIARSMAEFAGKHGEKCSDGSMRAGVERMRTWINGHAGMPLEEIDATIFRLVKAGNVYYGSGGKDKDILILSSDFLQSNERKE